MVWFAVAAAALQGLSAMGAQKTQNQLLKYQAARERINARLENLSAESSLKKGERQAQQIMIANEKEKGQAKVGYAANGVKLSSRSAQNVLNEMDYQTQSDVNQTEANALGEAWSHRLKATQHEGNAMQLKARQQNAFAVGLTTGLKSFAMSYAMGSVAKGFDSMVNNTWDSLMGNASSSGFADANNIVNPSMNVLPKTTLSTPIANSTAAWNNAAATLAPNGFATSLTQDELFGAPKSFFP